MLPLDYRIELPRLPAMPLPDYRVSLPRPPSTNNLFASVGRKRIKTKRYEAWIHEASKMMLVAGQRPRFDGRVRMLIEGAFKTDIDNIKAVPDLLVKMGVLVDDNLVDDLRIVRRGTGDLMTVSIWKLEGGQG